MRLAYQIIVLFIIIGSPLVSFAKEAMILEDRPTSLIYPVYWHIPFGIHRGTQDHLATFSQNRTQFNTPQGLACNRLLEDLGKANTITAFRLTVLGANSGRSDLIYNPTLLSLDIIGPKLDKHSTLVQPTGIALSNQGLAYITDPQAGTLWAFQTINGKLQPKKRIFASPPWQRPYGVAVDNNRHVYVSDSHSNCIQVFNEHGKQLRSIGPELTPTITLTKPRALAVVQAEERWSFYHINALYVCDSQGKRIIRMNLQGHVQTMVTTDMLGLTATAFAWMALDYFDNIWLTSTEEGKLYKLDKDLKLLTTFGEPGQGDYKFNNPTGIAIYRHFGQVFIAEAEAVHYFWIGSDIKDAKLHPNQQQPHRWTVQFFLTEPAAVTITVMQHVTKKAITICRDTFFYSGQQSYSFQLPKDFVQSAIDLSMTAEAIYSSRTHFKKKIRLKSDKSNLK